MFLVSIYGYVRFDYEKDYFQKLAKKYTVMIK